MEEEKGIAAGARTHDRLSGDIAGRARPVLNDERLPEPLLQPLAYQARGDIEPAAGRIADDDAHRLRRIGLCLCDTRKGRKHGSTGCYLEELSARQLHRVLLCIDDAEDAPWLRD